MGKYNFHHDFKSVEKVEVPLSPFLLPMMNWFLSRMIKAVKPPRDLKRTIRKIPGYQNGMIDLTIFEPRESHKELPCLIYFHGGAFVLQASTYHIHLLSEIALQVPCKVIFVDYRLAPKFAFPTGLEDCFAAYRWVCENSKSLGIDKDRIAVGGDSAGGALAAAVTLMARDRKTTRICFQMLVYPVTDARQITESMRNFVDTPLWNSKQNRKMWRLYLKDGVDIKREYFSPVEASSFANLPDAYIEVAEFDCLRDEGINYAECLQKDGVSVELNKTIGTIHGFEIVEGSELVRQSAQRRIAALKKGFGLLKK